MGKRLTGNLAMLLALVILAVPWTLHRASALESAAAVLSGAAVGLFGVALSFGAEHRSPDDGGRR